MNFGMRGHDFNASSIDELIEKCKEYGIYNIQLALKKTIADFDEEKFSEEDARAVGEKLKAAGIKVPVLGCYINPSATNPEQLKSELDFFVKNLHYAKYIGAETVGLETGFVGDTVDAKKNNTEEAYEHLLKNMKYLVSRAEEIGVNIAVEGVSVFVINSPQRLKRLLDDLNSPNVFTIFDPLNYLNNENYTEQRQIYDKYFELLGTTAKVMHLKDFTVRDGNIVYAYPKTGMLDTEYVIKQMSRFNPDIPVILEEVCEEKLNEVRNRFI